MSLNCKSVEGRFCCVHHLLTMSPLDDDAVVLRRVSFVKLIAAVSFGCVAGLAGLSGVLVIGYFLALSNAASLFYVTKVLRAKKEKKKKKKITT